MDRLNIYRAVEDIMRVSNCILGSAVLLLCFLFVPAIYAQDHSSTPSTQFLDLGFGASLPASSTGMHGEIPGAIDGRQVTDQPTDSGRLRLGYNYFFNSIVGLDASVAASRYDHNYFGDIDSASVESKLREFTGDFVFRIPDHVSWLHPYLLAGAGVMDFAPTGNMNNATGADSQIRSSLNYGGGVDFDISKRIGIRAEYRGASFKTPDFNVPELITNAQTHISTPSVGIYFKLSGYKTEDHTKVEGR